MGSTPESIRYICQQLQCRPETLTWVKGRTVVVRRGVNNKLGFHFKTFQSGGEETVTIIVKVKPDCQVAQGTLNTTDRILGISGLPVTKLCEAEVRHLLSQSHLPSITLLVAVMNKADPGAQVKRFLSINSGTSAGSGTASVDSADRPQVKRFAKSTSVEAACPPSPLADTTLVSPTPEPARQTVESAASECGGAARGRRLNHLTSTTHSLPATMEDEIVLCEDIVLCEADNNHHSLPPVLSPHPISPPTFTASSTLCAASLTTTGIGGIGSVADGGESSVGTPGAGASSLGVEVCRSPGCRLQNCLWHKFVLSNPQYVIWDPSTKTVVLDKNGSTSFGFKYKVKKHDGPPSELFALVTEVAYGGVAWNRLLPGDWIRSIDGTAIDSAREREAFQFKFSNLTSLRLILQRPKGLSPRAETKLRQLAKGMHLPLHIPPKQTDSGPASSPSPSPQRHQVPPASRCELGWANSYTPATPQGLGTQGGRNRSDSYSSGATNVLNSPGSPDPLLDQYPRQAQSPGEHIPLTTLRQTSPRSSSSTDKCVLPRARVVVCGGHASTSDFVRGLFSDNGVMMDPDAHAQCFQLSVQCTDESGVQINTWPEPLASLIQDGLPGSPGMNSAGPLCLNLELYVISDEDFFHHCTSWLLPSTNVVLLTFDVQRLLNQPEPETQRLATMVHTIRTGGSSKVCPSATNTGPAIMMYGVPSGSDAGVAVEEVQAIFYVTRYGHQLLDHYALSVPEVAQPACSSSMAAVCSALFHACLWSCQQTQVHRSVGALLDALAACPDVQLTGAKLAAMIGEIVPDADSALLAGLLHDLVTSGCLIWQGSSSPRSASGEQLQYLVPFSAFQALSAFLIKSDLDSHSPSTRQKWFKLLTMGRVSRADLCSILASDNMKFSVDLLEGLGVVHRLQSSSGGQGDSGFAEDPTEYVVPYFLIDLQPQESQGEGDAEGHQFVLTFPGGLSWQMYFGMLSAISKLPATDAVDPQGLCTCDVKHNGMKLSLHLRKNTNSVHVHAQRYDRKCRGPITVQQLERLFSYLVPPGAFRLCPAESVDSNSDLLSGKEVASQAATSRRLPPTDRDHETTQKCPPSMSEETAIRQQSSEQSEALLTSLPYSVLKRVALRLNVETVNGASWREVAELAGKSTDEIFAYESLGAKEPPAFIFLKEWMPTATVQQFLDILERLDRPDVCDMILKHCQ